MKEAPQDEELLEAVDLRKDKASGAAKRRHPGLALLLIVLLGFWAVAVFLFFTREKAVEDLPVEAVATALPPGVATAVPATPTPASTPTPLPASLRVESHPPGASVLRNGRFVGVTPLLVLDPRAGEPLQITLAGHAPRLLTLDPAEMGQTLTVELELQYAVIRVRLEPPGAQLWVNGTRVTLPDDGRLRLPQQEQVLRAEAEGHRPREVRVTPAMAYERDVDLRLQPETQP